MIILNHFEIKLIVIYLILMSKPNLVFHFYYFYVIKSHYLVFHFYYFYVIKSHYLVLHFYYYYVIKSHYLVLHFYYFYVIKSHYLVLYFYYFYVIKSHYLVLYFYYFYVIKSHYLVFHFYYFLRRLITRSSRSFAFFLIKSFLCSCVLCYVVCVLMHMDASATRRLFYKLLAYKIYKIDWLLRVLNKVLILLVYAHNYRHVPILTYTRITTHNDIHILILTYTRM